MKKKIRCWKAIVTNLTLQDAIKLVKENNFDGHTYDRIGIGMNKYSVIENFEIEDHAFVSNEILFTDWCVYVPDTQAEEMTQRCREILKETHYTGERYQAIDNMNIKEMFLLVFQKLDMSSDNVKYRLIKKIIEEKLYKE